jgi:hypothetical protein
MRYTACLGMACEVVFLFSDTQIVDEQMLEDLNNILNTGEVPSIFSREEKDWGDAKKNTKQNLKKLLRFFFIARYCLLAFITFLSFVHSFIVPFLFYK